MKIKVNPTTTFQPISVTLESQMEVNRMVRALNFMAKSLDAKWPAREWYIQMRDGLCSVSPAATYDEEA